LAKPCFPGDERAAYEMQAEISYDLVMDDEMPFVEGTYRLPGYEWQVVIFSRRPVAIPEIESTTWASGVSGIFVRFPEDAPLNRSVVEQLLGDRFGVEEWIEVHGPDSIQIR
jgi:hypothetical protein